MQFGLCLLLCLLLLFCCICCGFTKLRIIITGILITRYSLSVTYLCPYMICLCIARLNLYYFFVCLICEIISLRMRIFACSLLLAIIGLYWRLRVSRTYYYLYLNAFDRRTLISFNAGRTHSDNNLPHVCLSHRGAL